ncbi:MAG: sulfatase [Deltaproteobacteria bacterium]|nr:sulfatase [Candidatus Zymogenaceae bacterium]
MTEHDDTKGNRVLDETSKRISRRALLGLGAAGIAGAAAAYLGRESLARWLSSLSGRRVPDLPHIILIGLDTLRADSLGCYGYTRGTSPNIDTFCETGVLYTTTMSQSNWTLPAFASLFTGLMPHQHTAGLPINNDDGTMPTPLPQSLPVLPEILRELGYYTAAVTGGGYMSEVAGFARGFDEFYEIAIKQSQNSGEYQNDLPRQLEKATELLYDRHKKERLFLFIHSYECHHPYIAPLNIVNAMDPDYQGLPLTGDLGYDLDTYGSQFTELEIMRMKTFYDAEIFFSDRLLSLFFDALHSLKIFDDSLIIFTSDHGTELFDHGYWGHGHVNLHSELIDVPMIIKYPGGHQTGVVNDRIARIVDIFPTILSDVLGVTDLPEEIEGIPLSQPLPKRRAMSEAVMHRHGMRLFSMRDNGIKYIADNADNSVEAFNLADDPREWHDIAEEFPEESRKVALAAVNAEALFVANLETMQQGEGETIDAEDLQHMRDLGYME